MKVDGDKTALVKTSSDTSAPAPTAALRTLQNYGKILQFIKSESGTVPATTASQNSKAIIKGYSYNKGV
jgi:hypothetical protein